MRTTLTLDDDVSALLKHLRKSRNVNLKELVNQALRKGLREMTSPSDKRPRFRTKSADLGNCLIGDIDNIAELLAVVEDETFQ